MVALAVNASFVKITPLGSHDGEFCRFDRALIFEDPNGRRLIYDVGRTVAGADDKRLGDIDVVLLSHVHGDHLGDRLMESYQVFCTNHRLTLLSWLYPDKAPRRKEPQILFLPCSSS